MQITIGNLDTELLDELALRASFNARSPAEEARVILRHALARPLEEHLGDRLHLRMLRHGGLDVDLPARTATPRIPALADPPRLPEQLA